MHFKLKKTVTQATVLTALLPISVAFALENNLVGDSSGRVVTSPVRPACVGDGYWTPGQVTPACAPGQVDVGLRAPASSSPAAAAAAPASPAAASSSSAATVVAAAGAAPAATSILRDPSTAPTRGQYAYDAGGRNVRTAVTRECVKTGFWTPDTATVECDPDLFAKPGARAVAPPAEQQAEQPAAAPTEYQAPQYTEAPEYEAAPYTEPPAAAEEPEWYIPGDVAGLVPVPPPSGEQAPDDRISAPTMFYDEEQGVAADDGIIGRSQYYEEETVPQEETITGRSQYYEEETVPPEETIIGRSQFFEEEQGVAQDDGIVGRSQYYEEEQGVAQDDGIIGRSQYYEEEQGVAQDDGIIGQSRYYEEEGVQQDDGILARNQYYEEENVPQEETIVGRSQYYDEEGKAPEDLISEPQTAPEEQVAAAGEEAAPEAAQAETQAAPETAQTETQPEPVMLPVTVTLEAEPWFDFDRYFVRSDARDKLDRLVNDMSVVDYEGIIVVGHADRIGTFEYNQRLSERRAESVKRYLVGKGVPAGKIKTEGRGEFEPSLDPAVCKGMRKQKLIACLQPDRRVEVTVTGTKPQ